MKLTLILLLIPILVLFAACGQAADEPAGNGAPTENSAPAESGAQADNGSVAGALSQEEIDAARQVVYDYWEAFNAYDAEGALACLEESYCQIRADEIPGEIAQMEGAGVTLELEEEAEPVVTPEGIVVIQIKLIVPVLPDRHITYDLIKIDGEWKICGSEEL
jgi:hypothetical protein